MIVIAPTAVVSQLADIEDSIRGSQIIIEDGVVIDSFVKIKPVGGMGDIYIGRNTRINSGCVLYSGNGIHIGESVLIAANCTFAPVNHAFHARDIQIMDQGFSSSRGGIVVGNDVWIGAGTTILDGAKLSDGCVVGAMSLVRGTLEPYSINGGNPCRQLGLRT